MKALTFLFRLLVAVALVISAKAADRITATVTVTNYPASGDFLTINGSARQWSNVFGSTSIATNAALIAHGTNLYRHLITNGPAGPIYVTQTGPSNVSLLGNVGQAMTISATGGWALIGLSTQTVAVAKDVRVPFSVETASNAAAIASQLVSDLSTHSTNAFGKDALALTNFAAIRNGNGFFNSNHFLGSNVFTGSNTLTGPTLAANIKATNLTSAEGALTNSGVNVFSGTSRLGTATITNGTIVSGTLSNATIYMDPDLLGAYASFLGGQPLILNTNGTVTPTNSIETLNINYLNVQRAIIQLAITGYPLRFTNATTSGIMRPNGADTTGLEYTYGLAASNVVQILVTPSRLVLSNANFTSKVLFTNSTTLSSDPASGAEIAATSAELTYRTSAASEGAGQVNRLHNRGAEVVGSGTDYTLTASTAFVDFGGTDPDINTLPSAGTYLVSAIVTVTAGGTANDTYNFKLRNATTASDISSSAQSVTDAPAATKFQVVLSSVVTVTGADRIQLYGHNSTAARGTVNSTETKLIYVRLY